MGNVTLTKQNRLFWLGRYSERVFLLTRVMLENYDNLLETGEFDIPSFCSSVGIPCEYDDGEAFIRGFTFDKDKTYSIAASLDYMLGNGMVLREILTTPTLSYLQMAEGALNMARVSSGPAIELQWIVDDINAFRGSFDDMVFSEGTRNITKAGQSIERLSLMLRLNRHPERLIPEMDRLLKRLEKTDLKADPACLQTVRDAVDSGEIDKSELLPAVEGLFFI